MAVDTPRYVNLIRERSGIFLDESRTDILVHAVTESSAKNGMTSHEFFDLIVRDRGEFSNFLNLLTINETYFFREPAQIEIVADRLVPELMARKTAGGKTRILSAGCSTGEESYTLAMTMREKFQEQAGLLFSVTGIDIDGQAIRAAQNGVYSGRAFRGTGRHLLDKYFREIAHDQYQILEIIRNMVDFRTVNLSEYPYPDPISGMDMIFYRNVSIYFDKETQKRVFTNLSRILNIGGYLVVSSAETLSHDFQILSLTEINGYFFFKKNGEKSVLDAQETWRPECRTDTFRLPRGPRVSDPKWVLRPESAEPKRSAEKTEISADSIFDEALALAKSKQYEKALRAIQGLPNEDPRGHALKAGILINLNRLEDAKTACQRIVETDPMRMDGHLLAGLISKLERNFADAAPNLKKAVYLRASSWLAHFHLAEIYQSRGETDSALLAYQMVLKCLDKGLFSDHGLTFFPNLFSEKDIRHLCGKRLEHINARRGHGV